MSKGKKPDYYEPDSEYGYVRLPTMLSCAVDDTAITDRLLRYLVAIGSYSTRRNGNWCWPSRRKIAQRMGVSTTAVTKAMTTLAGLGYIEIRPRFENEAEEGKRGKQVSNYYRVLLDFELPPSRDRSLQERRRAGVGGRPKKSASDPPPPITPGVTPPYNSRELPPPITPGVTPPYNSRELPPPITPGVTQNLESESGNRNWKGRPANAGAVSPLQNREAAEPEPEPPPFRAAPPAEPLPYARFQLQYHKRHGFNVPSEEVHAAYSDYLYEFNQQREEVTL